MSQNCAYLHEAQRKNAIFIAIWTNFLQNTAVFSNILLQFFQTPVFWKKFKGSGDETEAF